MKKLKLVFAVILVLFVATLNLAFGADAAAPVANASPSILAWFNANNALILGVALAVSELLATIPSFQGNGILDTIIKALKALSQKN